MINLTLDAALQKAIESQKSGKVSEAEKLYSYILQAQPKHPDANHNMGVLFTSTGKVQEALPFFKTALNVKPSIPQFWLSCINILIDLSQLPEARSVFDKAKSYDAKGEAFDEMEAKLVEAEHNLSVAHSVAESLGIPKTLPLIKCVSIINLNKQNNFIEALAEAEQLLEIFPKSAFLHNNVGVSNMGLGEFEAAASSYQQALKIKPAFAEARCNMGIAFKKKGNLNAAINSFNQSIKIKPDYAQAYYHMGIAMSDQGDLEAAIDCFKRALKIKPDYAEAYCKMGIVLSGTDKFDAAIDCFKQALKINPDYVAAQHLLAARAGETPSSPPRGYVEELFDFYAPQFETVLLKDLKYRTPKILSEMIATRRPNDSLGSILDLGCGTGLVGLEIKKFCNNLEGIDLSQSMLEQARTKNVYDKLTYTDIVEYLSKEFLDFDYYISADVFIYVGDLSEIFRLIKSRNKRSGQLIFSTEHSDKNGFSLEPSGRYSHSKSYIECLCSKFGYKLSYFETTKLRKDKGSFLTGGLYFLDF